MAEAEATAEERDRDMLHCFSGQRLGPRNVGLLSKLAKTRK